MECRFIVDGKIRGKQRPRLGRFGAYTPSQTVNYENWIKVCFKQQCKSFYSEKDLKAEINIYHGIVKGTSKKNKKLMLLNELRPAKKPDIDNIVKVVLDSLNKIAFNDDNQVIEVTAKKFYSENEYIEVVLTELIK